MILHHTSILSPHRLTVAASQISFSVTYFRTLLFIIHLVNEQSYRKEQQVEKFENVEISTGSELWHIIEPAFRATVSD
jgi:hypothetical protein